MDDSLLNAVKDGFGFNGALHRLALDGLADDDGFVMTLDGHALGLGFSRLACVVGIAVAEVGAGAEKGNSQPETDQPGHGQWVHLRRNPWVVTKRRMALPQVNSITPQP